MADNYTPPSAREPVQRSRRLRWLVGLPIALLLIAPLGLYAWRYLFYPCEVEAVQEASGFLMSLMQSYDGVYQVAVTATRTAPDHPVNTLKQIYMDTQDFPVPACMQVAKKELLNYMGSVILAFQAYRSGEPDSTVRDLILQSDLQYANFQSELNAINACAPFCLPAWKD